jgi:hypothetical protein
MSTRILSVVLRFVRTLSEFGWLTRKKKIKAVTSMKERYVQGEDKTIFKLKKETFH